MNSIGFIARQTKDSCSLAMSAMLQTITPSTRYPLYSAGMKMAIMVMSMAQIFARGSMR